MTTTTSIAMWRPFYEGLRDAGLLENETRCRRVTIDAKVGAPLIITYEYYADADKIYDIARNIELHEGEDEAELVGKTTWPTGE